MQRHREMNNLDFSFFLEPPELSVLGILRVEALAPLSMVVAQPGAYYRSQSAPSDYMLYGLLENALGWHLDVSSFSREDLLKSLRSKAKKLLDKKSEWKDSDWLKEKAGADTSGVGFWSLLRYHLQFEPPHVIPEVERFEDLWSQHLHDNGRSFFGGSRSYDFQLEELITKTRTKIKVQEEGKKEKEVVAIELGDTKGFEKVELEEALEFDSGKLHYSSVRSAFPQYFVSPKKREYVIPKGKYQFRVKTTETLSTMIRVAMENPASPLYLGSNDGWVEVEWEVLS